MKRFAILALALVLGCTMLTGCRRQNPNGNMSTPPTEAVRPTTEPTTHATMPTTIPATEAATMPATEDATRPDNEPTTDATEPHAKGMMTDPVIK